MTTALAVSPSEVPKTTEAMWQEAGWLPCRATVEIDVPGFTVGDLLGLAADSVVVTKTSRSAEVLLRVNGQWLADAELEIVGERYSARLTDFAGQTSQDRGV